MSATPSTPRGRTQKIGPERVLIGWLIVLYAFLVRAVGKAFGVSGDGSTILTIVAIGSVARGIRRALAAPGRQVSKARSSPNFAGNAWMATAGFKGTVDGIAGRPSTETSFAATLIVFAVLMHSVRPAAARVRKSVRSAITQAFRLRAWFSARGSMIAARTSDVVRAAGRNPDVGSDLAGDVDR